MELEKLRELSALAEPIVKGYWPAVGGKPEQNYLARGEGGVSSRVLPLTKAQVDYLYALDEWFRANESKLAEMERDAGRLDAMTKLCGKNYESDLSICPPGNHGGGSANWLLTIQGPGKFFAEFEARTLGNAIDAARGKEGS